MYWQEAPDHRTSRTLDWVNDACQARLSKPAHDNDKVSYAALMSPAKVAVMFRDPCGPAECTRAHPVRRAWHSLRYRDRAAYLTKFPVSLLLAAVPGDTEALADAAAAGAAAQPQLSYLLFGTKKRIGKRTAVSMHERAAIRCVPAGPGPDPLQCMLRPAGARVDIELTFWTSDEAEFLRRWLDA